MNSTAKSLLSCTPSRSTLHPVSALGEEKDGREWSEGAKDGVLYSPKRDKEELKTPVNDTFSQNYDQVQITNKLNETEGEGIRN